MQPVDGAPPAALGDDHVGERAARLVGAQQQAQVPVHARPGIHLQRKADEGQPGHNGVQEGHHPRQDAQGGRLGRRELPAREEELADARRGQFLGAQRGDGAPQPAQAEAVEGAAEVGVGVGLGAALRGLALIPHDDPDGVGELRRQGGPGQSGRAALEGGVAGQQGRVEAGGSGRREEHRTAPGALVKVFHRRLALQLKLQ